jgi:hypothetical protein
MCVYLKQLYTHALVYIEAGILRKNLKHEPGGI